MKESKTTCGLACGVMAVLMAGMSTAGAVIVDFKEDSAGKIIDSEYATGGADNTSSTLLPNKGFTVVVDNKGGGPDIGVLYDTTKLGGEDPDLEGGSDGAGWEGGNRAGFNQGNALVIQERATGSEISAGKLNFSSGMSSQGPGFAPDDESGGGSIIFNFESQLVDFGFDWVDLDSPQGEGVTISFIDSLTGSMASMGFDSFTDLSSDFYRSGVVFGDGTANRISPISVADISGSSQVSWTGGSGAPQTFDQVRFDLSGSGGISTINFTPVPEPGTVLGGILLLGFAGFGIARRMRGRGAAGSQAS